MALVLEALNETETLAEELSWYASTFVEVYQESGAAPDRVLFVNPCSEGIQILVMAREVASQFFAVDKHLEQLSEAFRTMIPDLQERLKESLPEGNVLIVLDGVLGVGYSDFNYANYVKYVAELRAQPKANAPKVPGIQ